MKLMIPVLLSAALMGCSVGTSKPSQSTATDVMSKLTYIQDAKTGLCYAMISTSHTAQASDDGLSLTWVPCEPKVLEQIKR